MEYSLSRPEHNANLDAQTAFATSNQKLMCKDVFRLSIKKNITLIKME